MTKEEFFNSVDWISIAPYKTNIDFLCDTLKKNDIQFQKRQMFDNKYIVISHENNSLVGFLCLFDSNEELRHHCHFSRLDVKFDFMWKYSEIFRECADYFKYSNTISDSENEVGTIYFNSRGSDTFCRLYDKQKELGIEKPLSRLEYEVKGMTALSFSFTWTYKGFEEALNFLLGNISKFNDNHGIDYLMPDIVYCPSEPVNLSFDSDLKNRFSFFINHSKNTFKTFVDIFGIDKALDFMLHPDSFEYLWNKYYVNKEE